MTAHLVVIGAGGNIGSHLVPLVARMPGVARLTLIDRDSYEPHNLESQDAGARDVGRAKVLVQARRVRRANPALQLSQHHAPVEELPLGILRGDVILTCLDSRRSRQYVNQASRCLGVPWVDAGVRADGLLARVSIYSNADASPCMECSWDDSDYAAVEQAIPCAGHPEAPRTGAPASLGALAASLQALECRQLLATGLDTPSKEIVIDVRHDALWTTSLRRNDSCRLSQHSPWNVEPLPENALEWSLDTLVAACGGEPSTHGLRIEAAGRQFEVRRRCARCNAVRSRCRARAERATRGARCARCGDTMWATGFDCADSLSFDELSPKTRRSSLQRLGVRLGDVLTLRIGEAERHLEVTEVTNYTTCTE